MKFQAIVVLLLLSACSRTVDVAPAIALAPAAAPQPQSPAAQALVPLFDHHQHLLSEGARRAALDAFDGWPRPAVSVPPEIRRLLAARQAAWRDKAALLPLLHDKAVLLDGEGKWVIGADAVAQQLARTFGRPYDIRPVAYAADGSSGYVAGYYTRGQGDQTSYVGYFHLDLVRTGREWRILGETAKFPGPQLEPLVDGDAIVKMLDDAGIPKALVFSNAYYFAHRPIEQPGELDQVRAENDWTAAQVARHSGKLYAACSVNPLRAYAVREVERCKSLGVFRALKLHFNSSAVDLKKPEHLARVRDVFAAANRLGMPLIAHVQSEAGYGPEHVRIFLSQVVPMAPDVPVTVNHLWGGGAYSTEAAAALAVFAEAFARKDPATRNLWFDVAQIAMAAPAEADRAQMVARMREIGIERMLYGSDGPEWSGVPPAEHWKDFTAKMPLTKAELATIAASVAPYMR